MPAYEYTRVAIANNVVNQSAQIATGANSGGPKTHTNKYGKVHGVTAVDILTGTVTYVALEGSGYGFSIPFTGVPTDKEVDAMSNPYVVPGRLTVLSDLAPVSYNHSVAH
jgi:hypothetical protein